MLVYGPGAALVDARPPLVRGRPEARERSQRSVAARPATSGSRQARAAASSGCCSSTGRSWTGTSERSPRRSTGTSTRATPDAPRSLIGDVLRATLGPLAQRPFRTRPTFLPGAWGGTWLRERIGIETDAPNLAWSYELITPESGILFGGDRPSKSASSS